MTIKVTLTLCKSVGMSAIYIQDTKEFRILPANTPASLREARAYYTDCPFDAVLTAVAFSKSK